jgi:uncharacterized protein YciI
MKKTSLILFCFGLVLSCVAQNDTVRFFKVKEGDSVFVMKRYYLCIYIRGNNRSHDSATVAEIQKNHLKHINMLADSSKICMAGPFGNDTEKRGILIFDVADMQEAITLVKKDPAVIAGRLTYEIHPWWGTPGSKLK